MPRAFTPIIDVDRHRRLIKRLRASDDAKAHDLADVLATCTAKRPCRSMACPICGRAFQRAAVELQEREIGVPARAIRNRKHALSIVPDFGCVPPDGLTLKLYRRVRREIAAALIACDLAPNLFALDVSFNEDLTGRLPPHWCVHGDGIGLDWLPNNKISALKRIFPATSSVSKPIDVKQLDYEDEAVLYAYKPERVRRVSYLTDAGLNGRASHRDSKRRALRPWQSAELAMVEHAAGYRGRLIGHRIDESALDDLLCAWEWARDGP